MYRYYSIKRPLGKNTITLDVKKLNIHSFKDPVYCEEIKKKAWGYIDFEKPIEDSQARKYGLVPVDLSQRIPKTWYCVTTRSRRRHFESSITKTIESIDKPDSKTTQGNKETIYEDWFDSKIEALEWIDELMEVENPAKFEFRIRREFIIALICLFSIASVFFSWGYMKNWCRILTVLIFIVFGQLSLWKVFVEVEHKFLTPETTFLLMSIFGILPGVLSVAYYLI